MPLQPRASAQSGWSGLKLRLFAKFRAETPAGSIFRNMAVLASGTMVGKVIGLATMPVITRIYTPEHLGVLSIFASLVGLLLPFGTLRYSAAIPLPRADGTAANLFALCLISLTGVSTLTGLLLWFFAPVLLAKLSMKELLPYWWLLVVAVASAGLYEILGAWATRNKAFKPLAKTQIWQSISSALVKIGLGLLGFKPIGLLIGHIIAQAGGCTFLAANFYPKLKANFKQVSAKRVAFVFNRYSDFLKFRLPSQFLLAFSVSAPLLFSAMLFGKETTGQLGLALTTLALPIALFGNTTGQAYYAEIAKIGRKNPDQIRQITNSVTKKLFLISILPFLVLLLLGPWLFAKVFGEVWREAGRFVSILAFYLLAQFVSAPLINVLNVFNKQWLFLRINIVRSFLSLLVFGTAYFFSFEATITIIIYSIVLTVHYAVVSIAIFRVIK
jgi:O-antigen/teichoic acid export membrane protein